MLKNMKEVESEKIIDLKFKATFINFCVCSFIFFMSCNKPTVKVEEIKFPSK